MTKDELIQLLKTYRESKAKLRLREKDLIKYNKDMKEAEKELEIMKTRKLGINSDIRTKNKISDTTANAVIRREQHIAEMKEKIAKTEEEKENIQKGKIARSVVKYIEGDTYDKKRLKTI